jgi:hypothetical protein
MTGRDLPFGTIVRNIETDRQGVVCPDHSDGGVSGCICFCAEFETPVLYYGKKLPEAAKNDKLEEIGPENPHAIAKKCGIERSWPWRLFTKKPCTFLINDNNCGRHGILHHSLANTADETMRIPTSPFPKCQAD